VLSTRTFWFLHPACRHILSPSHALHMPTAAAAGARSLGHCLPQQRVERSPESSTRRRQLPPPGEPHRAPRPAHCWHTRRLGQPAAPSGLDARLCASDSITRCRRRSRTPVNKRQTNQGASSCGRRAPSHVGPAACTINELPPGAAHAQGRRRYRWFRGRAREQRQCCRIPAAT
jgi:hypothetical protein